MGRASLFVRLGAGAAAVLVLGAGLLLATRSQGNAGLAASTTVTARGDSAPPSAAVAIPSATPSLASTQPAEQATEPATVAAPAPTQGPAQGAVSAARPPTPGSTAAPAPTSGSSGPISDTPRYTDLQVLNMAAAVKLPSGRTFQDCVSLPGSKEKWPLAVHDYYEGHGKWLVETHVSEIQVEFDEATGQFTVRHFAPPDAACLIAP